MKRVVGIVLGVAAVMAAIVALTAGTALAQPARPYTYTETIPVSEEMFNPCTGETVTYEGKVQVLITEIVGDERYHGFSLHRVHLQGVSDSGARYILLQSATQVIKFDSDSATTEHTRIPIYIIRQGEDGTQEDFKANLLVHFTQNANGEITAQFEVVEWECN